MTGARVKIYSTLIYYLYSNLVTAELPAPKSLYLDALRANQESGTPAPSQERPITPPRPASPQQAPNSAHSRRSRRESMTGLESDPWGSPELHRGHAHAQLESDHPVLNGYGSVRSATNAWSSRVGEDNNPNEISNSNRANSQTDSARSHGSGFGWGESLGNTPSDGGLGGTARAGLGGFGPPSSDHSDSNPRRRSLGIGRVASPPVEEHVTVTLLPEKEGMFMFQHRNYEVKSARRGSTVVRRYSDFVWLLDCLQKRYPFRQLPLLPPKRLSGMSKQKLFKLSLLTSFRKSKSMALTLQRIPMRSLKSVAVASSDLPMPLSDTPFLARSNS